MNYIKYQLYLLQIENYEVDRFFRLLFKKGFYKSSSPLRKSLVWTRKIILILIISLLLLTLGTYLALNVTLYLGLIWLIASLLVMPVYFSFALYVIMPFDALAKRRLINKARDKILRREGLKIIGIAGSYGKTTLKNVLNTVLSEKYNVGMPSGNTNTALGLSAWVLDNDLDRIDIILVEFGEEYPGDNKRIANIFPQDISIITGINEAHLERMGKIEKTAETIFEALSGIKTNASVFLSAEDKNVKKYYKQHTENLEGIEFYDSNGFSDQKLEDQKFDNDDLAWSVKISEIGEVSVNFLAQYIFADIAVAVRIASSFGLSPLEIKGGLSKIKPVEHRLQPINNYDTQVLVIDDSYNGNPQGVDEAIKVLGLFKGRRRLYLTPGLVEAATESKAIHNEIGRKLAEAAEKVILIKNSATPYIAEGLLSAGYNKEDIIWFATATEAHQALGGILKPNDVILFQNDWGDQYL